MIQVLYDQGWQGGATPVLSANGSRKKKRFVFQYCLAAVSRGSESQFRSIPRLP